MLNNTSSPDYIPCTVLPPRWNRRGGALLTKTIYLIYSTNTLSKTYNLKNICLLRKHALSRKHINTTVKCASIGYSQKERKRRMWSVSLYVYQDFIKVALLHFSSLNGSAKLSKWLKQWKTIVIFLKWYRHVLIKP